MDLSTLIFLGAGLIITTGVSFFFASMVKYGNNISTINEKLKHIEDFLKERSHEDKIKDEAFYEIKGKLQQLEKATSAEEYKKLLSIIIADTHKIINSLDIKTIENSAGLKKAQDDILVIKKYLKSKAI